MLLIGADQLSRFVDWRDRGTCILFGDGCGAVLLQGVEGADCGLLGYAMHSDGNGQKSLNAVLDSEALGVKPLNEQACRAEGSFKNLHMNGQVRASGPVAARSGCCPPWLIAFRLAAGCCSLLTLCRLSLLGLPQEVFKFAVRSVPSVIQEALDNAAIDKSQVDLFVLHQANQRILDAVAERFGVPNERVVSNLGEYGNTSAATIPIALDEAVRSNKVKAGDVLAFAGFGAGLTWTSAICRWN